MGRAPTYGKVCTDEVYNGKQGMAAQASPSTAGERRQGQGVGHAEDEKKGQGLVARGRGLKWILLCKVERKERARALLGRLG